MSWLLILLVTFFSTVICRTLLPIKVVHMIENGILLVIYNDDLRILFLLGCENNNVLNYSNWAQTSSALT